MPTDVVAPRHSRRMRLAGSYTALTIGAVVVLAPIYFTIVNSLLPPSELAHQPPPLFPTSPQWHDYSQAWTSGHLARYMATSAVMTISIVVGQLITSVLAA